MENEAVVKGQERQIGRDAVPLLARLVPAGSSQTCADELTFEGRDLRAMPKADLRRLRGRRIGFIFQNPLSSLNPLLTVGEQIAETLRVHLDLPRRVARPGRPGRCRDEAPILAGSPAHQAACHSRRKRAARGSCRRRRPEAISGSSESSRSRRALKKCLLTNRDAAVSRRRPHSPASTKAPTLGEADPSIRRQEALAESSTVAQSPQRRIGLFRPPSSNHRLVYSFTHSGVGVEGRLVVENNKRPTWTEGDRLAALRRYDVLDTPPEPAFDGLVRLAAQICDAPMAAINLLDDRRQWFKAEVGWGVRETALDIAICAHAILQPGLFIVEDATKDPRFAANPLVTGRPHIRFYAGALLETPAGLPLGTLCVLDHRPRELNEQQRFALTTLAAQAMSQLELRRILSERDEALAARRQVEGRQSLLIRELHHRVRNALATVQALLGATARSSASVEEFHRTFSDRIASLARTQTLLTEDYWQTAPFREMLEQALRPFLEGDQGRFLLKGPAVELSADLAVPVGMAIHELAVNAAMHGALSVGTGWIEVTWDLRQVDGVRRFHLAWIEHDGQPVTAPKRAGFGSTLLERVLPAQARAEVSLSYDPAGLRFEMSAPLVEQRSVPEY